MQRYEGASTLFGPCELLSPASRSPYFGGPSNHGLLIASGLDTLDAYIEKYSGLVNYLVPGVAGTLPSDALPIEQTSRAISFQVRQPSCQVFPTSIVLQTGAVMDNPPQAGNLVIH